MTYDNKVKYLKRIPIREIIEAKIVGGVGDRVKQMTDSKKYYLR